jgi:DNA-binding transcriptional ArsR family regulator
MRNKFVTRLSVDAVAQALADPIRRDILRILRAHSATAGALAGAFDVSRPAVSRHLRVLREAGLVRDELRGRERVYQIDLSALTELEAFLHELRATGADTWKRRLMALETEVYRVRRERRRANTTSHGRGGNAQPSGKKKEKTA